MILETLRAELAVGFIEKEKKNESGKIVFSKGGASVDDDFHDDGHAGARAFRRNRSGTTRTGRRDGRGSPRIDVPVSLSLEEFVVTAIPG